MAINVGVPHELVNQCAGESADGGVAAGGTDSAAVAEEEKKVKAKEADDDMGFGSWDLNVTLSFLVSNYSAGTVRMGQTIVH